MPTIHYGVFCANEKCKKFIRFGSYEAGVAGENRTDVSPGRDALQCPHCEDEWQTRLLIRFGQTGGIHFILSDRGRSKVLLRSHRSQQKRGLDVCLQSRTTNNCF